MRRLIILSALLSSVALGGSASAWPEYQDVRKAGGGAEFDTANNYCSQKTGDRYGETRAHKTCMLSQGWRSEHCPYRVSEDSLRDCKPD
jgi:hypothetical protein